MDVSKGYTTQNIKELVEYDKKQIIDLLKEEHPEITDEQIATIVIAKDKGIKSESF